MMGTDDAAWLCKVKHLQLLQEYFSKINPALNQWLTLPGKYHSKHLFPLRLSHQEEKLRQTQQAPFVGKDKPENGLKWVKN